MSGIFVTKVRLTEFRSFATLDVDLPAEPGVMIVHGTNGLGKSSLFDGLEWALTGKIDHFRDATKRANDKDYLRRWHAPNDRPTQVSMGFSDGKSVTRTIGSEDLGLSGFEDVAAYLRTPSWKPEIGELQRYLLLTHFLGQSTLSRMTHRKPEERWEFLQQPAQSDWANRIATALHGHGSSIPARAFERKAEELSQEADRLEHLLLLEERQWQESLTEGAIDEEHGRSEAEALFNQLSELAPLIGSHRPSLQTTAADATVDAVHVLTSELAESARRRELRLTRSRGLLDAHRRVQEALVTNEAHRAAAQAQVGASDEELRSHAQNVAHCRAVLLEAETQAAAGAGRTARLIALQDLRTQAQNAHHALSDAHALAARLAGEVESATASVGKEERRRAIVARLESEIGDLANRAQLQATRLENLKVLERAERARVDAVSTLESAKVANASLEERLAVAAAAAAASIVVAETLAAEFDELKRTVGALSAAVAAVAANLPGDQCDCPVCATSFGSVEELRTKVASAAERLAPALSDSEKRMIQAEAVRERRLTALAHLREVRVEMVGKEDALALANARRDEVNRDLFGNEPFSESALRQSQVDNEIVLAKLVRSRSRKEYWQQHRILGGNPGSLASWSRAVRRRNELQAEREDQDRRVGELSRALRTISARLSVAASETPDGDTASDDGVAELVREAQMAQEDLAARLDAAREDALTASKAQELALQSAAERRAHGNELQKTEEALRNELAAIENEWRSLEIAPASLALEEVLRAERLLAEATEQRSMVEQRLQRLREGRQIWKRQIAHRETVNQLRESAGSAPNVGRDALRAQVRAIQSTRALKVISVLNAKGIAQRSYGEVTKAVAAFNHEYLMPLNTLMNKLNRAILSEPDIGLDLRVGKKKVEQRAIKSADAPAHVSKLDPQLVHSEGQMAALAVSMLCAASLTFPWSRWRSLILDDPLQHNDAIHAAAFADMLCNLIRAKGYQVFLSTHDLAQAEFLRRKFHAASVPCTMVHLLGRGPTGIDSSNKYHSGHHETAISFNEVSQSG